MKYFLRLLFLFIPTLIALKNNALCQNVFKIPVVVHVIHADGNENISNEQIINGITILTRNWRKQNPDTTEIVPVFKSRAADMEVEFELAKIDPWGNCTNGITRTRSELSLTGGHQVKELVHWPRNKYLNIYVVRNAAGLAGHALMPFQADSLPEWDGIVISHDYLGNIGTSNDLKSVVLSHEVGHYLNLFHIWGGNNVPGFYYLPVGQDVNCAIGDSVADTPPTKGWSSCNLNGITCNDSLDNVQNFMDYAYCARMFTQGQKSRVHEALNSPIAERNQLWTTQNLIETGLNTAGELCKADFLAKRRIFCSGENVPFTDLSYHQPQSWSWQFGDGLSSNAQNPQHNYTNEGIYNVKLTAQKAAQTLAEEKQNYIRILNSNGLTAPYSEGFEGVSILNQSSIFVESDSQELPQITGSYSAGGTNSLFVHSFNDSTSFAYLFSTPKINMLNVPNAAIAYKYAFTKKDSTNLDKMLVKVSKNCGLSWITVKNYNTSNLATTTFRTNEFFPISTDWKSEIIQVPSSIISSDNVLVRVEFYSAGGNNFFLDDLFIGNLDELSLQENTIFDFDIYPNPASNALTISGGWISSQSVAEIITINGQVLSIQSLNSSSTISLNQLSSGIYFLRIKNLNGQFGMRKLAVVKE